jgi:hypothetical protein
MTNEQKLAIVELLGAFHAELVLRCARCRYEAKVVAVTDIVAKAKEGKQQEVERIGEDAMNALLSHVCKASVEPS